MPEIYSTNKLEEMIGSNCPICGNNLVKKGVVRTRTRESPEEVEEWIPSEVEEVPYCEECDVIWLAENGETADFYGEENEDG